MSRSIIVTNLLISITIMFLLCYVIVLEMFMLHTVRGDIKEVVFLGKSEIKIPTNLGLSF